MKLHGKYLIIAILLLLLVHGLTFNGFSPAISERHFEKPFRFTPYEETAPLASDSSPKIPPIWHINQSYSALSQNATLANSLGRAPTKYGGTPRNLLLASQGYAKPHYSETLLLASYPANTVFKLINGHIYLYLDMPPPSCLHLYLNHIYSSTSLFYTH